MTTKEKIIYERAIKAAMRRETQAQCEKEAIWKKKQKTKIKQLNSIKIWKNEIQKKVQTMEKK